jgi:HEAT repeat protein
MLTKTLRSAALAAAFMAAAAGAVPLQPGEQLRWSLDFRARLEQGARPVEIHLTGGWVSTVVAVRPAGYDCELQIVDAGFAGDSVKEVSAAALQDLRNRLSRPFWATYRADGALLGLHFYKDVTPTDRNLLQTIATESQLVRPAAGGSVWSVEERDGAGAYLAMYGREGNTIVKRKVKYTYTDGVAGAPADAVQVHVDESELRFSLGPQDEVLALAGGDRVHLGVSFGNAGTIAAITEIHLGNFHAGQAPGSIGNLARVGPDVKSFSIVTHRPDPAEARAQSDDRLLNGASTESLLEAAIAGKDSSLPERLAALFRRRPEAAAAAESVVRKNGSQKSITNALGAAGSQASITAIRHLATDRTVPSAARADAILALVQLQHPAADAMGIPLVLLDDADPAIRTAARMIAGALARAGRVEHPAEADAIDGALVARYRKAREIPQVCEALSALGNSIGPTVIPAIREALHDPRATVRAAAVRALRLAPGQEVEQALTESMLRDSDPRVRADAIFATRFRRPLSPTLGEALVRAARADRVDYVRSDAVSLLRKNLNTAPGAAETLAWVAENDSNAGVRRQAREGLAEASR